MVQTSLTQHLFRLLLGTIMVFAGTAHLTFQRQEFQAQVPTWLSTHPGFIDFVVLASGVVEISLGLAVLFSRKYRIYAGMALAMFFVLIFPGNISQFTNGVNAFGLDTDQKRFIRLFFQPVLVLWALWCTGAWSWLSSHRINK